ncbi:hypothetical protein LOTGIDRAFT_148850, partial [Lottia gigantea]
QVDKEQFDKVMKYINIGQKEGAKMTTGGKRVGDKGYFIEPTIFKDVGENMKIQQEEVSYIECKVVLVVSAALQNITAKK